MLLLSNKIQIQIGFLIGKLSKNRIIIIIFSLRGGCPPGLRLPAPPCQLVGARQGRFCHHYVKKLDSQNLVR